MMVPQRASRLLSIGWRHVATTLGPQRHNISTKCSGAQVYAVFGATGGIGSCLSQRLVSHPGTAVVLVGRDQGKLDALANTLQPASTGIVTTAVADVTSPDQVEAVIARAVEAHGHVTGVVNCVGSIVLKGAHQTTPAEFDQVVKLNLYSSFYILRSAVKAMMTSGGGSLVFCSSAVAKHGFANHEAIAAAKAGIEGLALSAAATYASKNIRVNCVAPGLTRTPLAARITGNPGALKASEAMHALKRIGEPDEVAATIEFLLSQSFVTGQCLGVDGGLGSLKPQ